MAAEKDFQKEKGPTASSLHSRSSINFLYQHGAAAFWRATAAAARRNAIGGKIIKPFILPHFGLALFAFAALLPVYAFPAYHRDGILLVRASLLYYSARTPPPLCLCDGTMLPQPL